MYRNIQPESAHRLPLRMLFQPAGDGVFYRACEADSFRGLVAALLDDPAYERADAETSLVNRIRLANDAVLLGDIEGHLLQVGDRPGPHTIDISSDESFVRSLHELRTVSLEPALTQEEKDGRAR
jgi:hypothetical protein